MLVPLDRMGASAYAKIKRDALNYGTTVLIFVSLDVDSLCACKILESILKSDSILHEIAPVPGFTELTKKDEELIKDNTQLRSIILLNCGGMIDLESFFGLSEDMTVYVADSHRPLNLHNIFGNQQVAVLDDGEMGDTTKLEEAFAFLQGEESASDQDGSGSEDDDGGDEDVDEDDGLSDDGVDEEPKSDNNQEENGQSPKGRRRSDDEPPDPRKRKRRRLEDGQNPKPERQLWLAKRRRRKAFQRVIAEYYAEGTFTGMPCSWMIYSMALQLGCATSGMLWNAIIGLTDLFLHEKIDRRRYRALADKLGEEVSRFNINSIAPDGAPGDGEEDFDFGLQNQNENEQKVALGITTAGKAADDHTIRQGDEFRLMLLRHWNLRDSMFHSSYVASKLGIWKEKGRQRLVNMMVQMGFPHKECREPFTAMHIKFKHLLRGRLSHLSARYNLADIVYPSFFKHQGFKCTISASDAVYSLSALLDHGRGWILQHALGADDTIESSRGGRAGESCAGPRGSIVGAGGGVGARSGGLSGVALAELNTQSGVGVGTKTGAAAVSLMFHVQNNRALSGWDQYDDAGDDENDPNRKEGDEENDEEGKSRGKGKGRGWMQNFFIAYDALDSFDLLYHGIHLSMQLQKALVRTGLSVIDKHQVKTLKNYRYAILSGLGTDSIGLGAGEMDASIFARSMSLLQRLASFIAMVYQEYHQKQLPLVIAAPDLKKDSFIVVGLQGYSPDIEVKNQFGLAFQTTAERTGANVRYDGFESSVIEIKRDDFELFMKALDQYEE
ncbi:CDC45 family [Cladochytrium replicatum]|nr:CDC45 family [Cladochytrium replicatum]